MSLKEILTLGWAKSIWRSDKTLQAVKTTANNAYTIANNAYTTAGNAYEAIGPMQQTISNHGDSIQTIDRIIERNGLDSMFVRALKHSTIEHVTPDSYGNIDIAPASDTNSVFYGNVTRTQTNTKTKITINTNSGSTIPPLGFWYISVLVYIEDMNSQDYSEGSFFDFGWYHTNAQGQTTNRTNGYVFIKGLPTKVDAGMYEFNFMLFDDAPSFGNCAYYGTNTYVQQ